MKDNEWNQFAWQEISFVKPQEWDLGAVEGTEDKGYLRLDDHILSRLELRWQKQVRGVAMEKVLARHLRDLKRKAGKRKIDFKILNKKDYRTEGVQGIYFIWEGDFRAVNVLRQCKKCWRLILVTVLGKKGGNIEKEAMKIFNSLRDHTNGNKVPWSVFDFHFTTPPELKLNGHTFLSGHLKFDFLHGEDSFIFEQLSVANIVLKGKSLSQWVSEFLKSQFKSVDIEVIYPREGNSEEGIYIKGREYGKVRLFKKRFLKSFFWHCQKTNHIFGVAELIKKQEESRLDSLVSGVKCH